MCAGRLHAASYDLVMKAAEHAGLGEMRAELLAGAAGRTLEIGAGAGHNIDRYRAAVSELVVTEPDRHMAKRLRRRVRESRHDFPIEVIHAYAERLPFNDTSFDTVVSTLVLCTVADPDAAAAELARVLRPGGTLLVLEHVRSPDEEGLARWQDRFERPWGWFAGGCHPNRDTTATLVAAGFDPARIERDEFGRGGGLIRPVIRGATGLAAG